MGVYNDLMFTEAIEDVDLLISTKDPDTISDLIERIAVNQDLALACLMLLTMKVRGVDTSDFTGVALANTQPTISSLILPPGVIL